MPLWVQCIVGMNSKNGDSQPLQAKHTMTILWKKIVKLFRLKTARSCINGSEEKMTYRQDLSLRSMNLKAYPMPKNFTTILNIMSQD